jgi:hypothetical protein
MAARDTAGIARSLYLSVVAVCEMEIHLEVM